MEGALELRPLPRFTAACVTCGACAAACPTGALEWRPSWPVGEPPSVVSCDRARGGDGARVSCLSALGLGELANLVRVRGSVTVVRGECEGCPLAPSLGVWRRNRDRLRATLVALGEPESRLVERTGSPEERVVAGGRVDLGRRGFLFNLWGTRVAESGSALKRLADGHPGPRRESAGEWSAPSILPGCDGCGRCSDACPTGGIVRDGAGFVVDPLLCAPGCRLCAEVCPRRCLEVVPAGRTPSPTHSLPLESGVGAA